MSKSDLSETFGYEVRRRREARNMTLEVLADRAGLTPNFIGTVETGKRDPSLSTVLALARGIGVKPGELFGVSPNLSAAAEEAGRLYDISTPQVQKAVLSILRAIVKRPRK